MSFRGLLRPGQGFKPFTVLRRQGATTKAGRPYTGDLETVGQFFGMISQASPREVEQWKQLGTPITHTIVQRGTKNRAKATDVLELTVDRYGDDIESPRRFLVQGDPQDPGELGHFLVYKVEERKDLNERSTNKQQGKWGPGCPCDANAGPNSAGNEP